MDVMNAIRARSNKSQAVSPPVLHIRPAKGWIALRLRELWEYRELMWFLGWRDVTVRYKQTVLGATWAIIQPFTTMVVFSIFFGKLARMPSDGIPYPIFSYAAILPWTFFTAIVTSSSMSLLAGSRLIKKVYFPRLIIPLATVVTSFIDFAIAFVVLIGMMIYFQIAPTINILFLPLFILLAAIAALGTGLWLAASNVKYRDVRYTVPFMVQIWMFATPIVYPSSLLSEPWRTLYGLNPMAGVVEGFRWALLGVDTAPGPMIVISSVVAITVFVSGAFYFRRMERTFADLL
jgi:lipopolysaccharide transport system permease protein